MLHHCITVGLILAAWLNGEHAVGLVILYVHDTSDVVLDLMKICNYLKLEDGHGLYITETFFVGNLVSWVYYRMYVYPLHILYHGSVVGFFVHCGEGTPNYSAEASFLHKWCIFGCSLLACLHVFWFCLFLRIAHKLVNGSASQAGKEEYEGGSESDSDEGEGKKTD